MKSQTQLSDFTFTFHFHALEKEKEMLTHSSILAWRISGTEEPWWAAVYGVAQIRTQLKWLSRSRSIMSAKNIDKKYGNMLIWRWRNFIFFHGLRIQKVKEREEKYPFGSWTPSDILLLLFKTAKIPLHSREKKSISTHQNTDTSFPNQETLTSQSSNPTHWAKSSQ